MIVGITSAQEKFPGLDEVAKKIRNGQLDVGTEMSMDPRAGRFHKIHVQVLGLGCGSCHGGKEYATDYLLVRKHAPLPEDMPGIVDHSTCLGCHKRGGVATSLYGTAAE